MTITAHRDNMLDPRDNTNSDLQDHCDNSVPPAQQPSDNQSQNTPRPPLTAGAQQTGHQQPNTPNSSSADSNDGLTTPTTTTPTTSTRPLAHPAASTRPVSPIEEVNAGLRAGMTSKSEQDADGASIVVGRKQGWVKPRWQKYNRRKWVLIGVGLATVSIIMVIAVVLGVVLPRKAREKRPPTPSPSPSTPPRATVRFFAAQNDTCDGVPTQEYRNITCGNCVDPPGGWQGAQVTGVNDSQRISFHNMDGCTPVSQVAQTYGNTCLHAGKDLFSSVWVDCHE